MSYTWPQWDDPHNPSGNIDAQIGTYTEGISTTWEQTSNPSPVIEGPKLILLCGIPGIGKDFLCDYVCEHFPFQFQWFKCISQDQYGCGQGAAQECKKAVKLALTEGYSVIVKRNNHTIRDRKFFADMAR